MNNVKKKNCHNSTNGLVIILLLSSFLNCSCDSIKIFTLRRPSEGENLRSSSMTLLCPLKAALNNAVDPSWNDRATEAVYISKSGTLSKGFNEGSEPNGQFHSYQRLYLTRQEVPTCLSASRSAPRRSSTFTTSLWPI